MSDRNLSSSLVFNGTSLQGIVSLASIVHLQRTDAAAAAEESAPPPPPPCWQVLDASKAIYLYAFPLLLLVGILFNGVNFVLFRSSIGLRLYSFTVFICTLSVTDSLALVAQAPRRWLTLLHDALHCHLPNPTSPYDTTTTSEVVCKAVSYAAELLQFISLWTVVLIAWERSIVARNPYRQSRFRQTRTACHAVAFVIISGLVLKTHVILSWQTTTTTLPAVAMPTGNATTSLLTSAMTPKRAEAFGATTKRPARRNLAVGRRRCTTTSYNSRGVRMKKTGCAVEGNGERDKTQEISDSNRKWQKEEITQMKKQELDRHLPSDLRVNDHNETTTTFDRPHFSSTDNHHHERHHERHRADSTNNSSSTDHLDQKQPNEAFLNDSSIDLHRMVSNPTDTTTTSSKGSADVWHKMETIIHNGQVTVSVSDDTTRHRLTTNGTRQNETDISTDVDWKSNEGSPPQSRPLTDQRNASNTNGTSGISFQGPDDIGSKRNDLLGNFSSYSVDDEASVEEGRAQRKKASNDSTFQQDRRRRKRHDSAETPSRPKPCSHYASRSGQCQFIDTNNVTETTTVIWMVSVAVEALTKVLPVVLLSGLLVSSLAGLRRWNIDQTRLTTDLTCRLLMERHVTVMAVCIMTSQVVLCLPMSVVWMVDVYFRLVTDGRLTSGCEEAQMEAATILTEIIFITNFTVKFLLCFLSGRQILSI